MHALLFSRIEYSARRRSRHVTIEDLISYYHALYLRAVQSLFSYVRRVRAYDGGNHTRELKSTVVDPSVRIESEIEDDPLLRRVPLDWPPTPTRAPPASTSSRRSIKAKRALHLNV
jgi:hypothetical protein